MSIERLICMMQEMYVYQQKQQSFAESIKEQKRNKRQAIRDNDEIEYFTDYGLLRSRILEKLNIELPCPEKAAAIHKINNFLQRNHPIVCNYQKNNFRKKLRNTIILEKLNLKCLNKVSWKNFNYLGISAIKNTKWNLTMDYLTKMIDKTFFIYERGLSL